MTALSLAMLIAACGGGAADESSDPAGTIIAGDEAGDEAGAGQLVAAVAETDGETASDTAGEAPSAPEAPSEGEGAEAPEADAPEEDVVAAPKPSAPAPASSSAPAASLAVSTKPPAGFMICGACHKVAPGRHGIGPSLANVFGAKAGQASGFEYSLAMKESGLTWDEATLNRYLENPKAVVPGTLMVFFGERNPAKRQALIDYLKTL